MFHLAALALALLAQATPESVRLDRARSNYEALANGRIHWNQLNPRDLEDLRAFAEAIREQIGPSRTPSERCFDAEFRRYGRSLTNLQQRLIDLRCRPIGDPLD